MSKDTTRLPRRKFRRGPSILFNAETFLADRRTAVMSPAQIGRLVTDVFLAVERRDSEYLKQFPFVERLFRGTATRESLPPSIRKAVLSAGRCALCGSNERLTVDHIRPYSQGGTHDLSNLQCLCWPCNRAKSDKWEGEE